MSAGRVDCLVVGGGPAGLAASAALRQRGVDHLVLEKDRVGESWRSRRWDTFRLNTPGWMNQMLGPQDPDSYAGRDDVVQRLDDLAAACAVRDGVAALGMSPAAHGYLVRTSAGDLRARAVVVASGDQNVPLLPRLAGRLPTWVEQCHTGGYRSAAQLPAGGVLVVGSAQSGCQIAQDLLDAGRRVVLATSPVGRIPGRYRGRPGLTWLVESGFYDQPAAALDDPSAMRAPNPLAAPGARSLSLQGLARAGAELVGRPVAVYGDRVSFDDSVGGNLAVGDAFAAQVRRRIDGIIRAHGLQAPPPDGDEDEPFQVRPAPDLDLRGDGIGAVLWCTGFTGDFSWLDPALLDGEGRPRHHDVAGPVPGLWYVGLRWLSRRGSSILRGFPRDAATVAEAVRAHLGQ